MRGERNAKVMLHSGKVYTGDIPHRNQLNHTPTRLTRTTQCTIVNTAALHLPGNTARQRKNRGMVHIIISASSSCMCVAAVCADAYRRGCHRRHCRRAIPGELAKLSKQCSAESKPARAGGEGKGQWKRMRKRESSFFFGSFNFLAHSAVGSLAAGFVFCASSSVHVVFVAVRASCIWFPLVPVCYSTTAHNHRLTDFASHHHPASEARRSSQLQHKFRPFAFMMTYLKGACDVFLLIFAIQERLPFCCPAVVQFLTQGSSISQLSDYFQSV